MTEYREVLPRLKSDEDHVQFLLYQREKTHELWEKYKAEKNINQLIVLMGVYQNLDAEILMRKGRIPKEEKL